VRQVFGRFARAAAAGALAGTAALSLAAGAHAEALPDLTIVRHGPTSVAARTAFEDKIVVTNKGTASAQGVTVDYEPNLSVAPRTKGILCSAIMKGHSGRGGGYTQVGWSCSETLSKPLAPTESTTVVLAVKAPAPESLVELFSVAPYPAGSQANLVSHTTSDTVAVFMPPLPGQPTGVTASRVGDRLHVAWVPAAATKAYITQTQVTATPVGETTAAPASGTVAVAATSGTVGVVVPGVTYRITVAGDDAAGAGPASEPVEYTTPPSTVPPSAPTGLRSWWINPSTPIGTSIVGWTEPKPGDSAIDEYQIRAVPLEPEEATTLVLSAPAGATEAEITANSETPWTVRVRAHNAAGWGAWSAAIERGGL
jgi:hypothetical protein